MKGSGAPIAPVKLKPWAEASRAASSMTASDTTCKRREPRIRALREHAFTAELWRALVYVNRDPRPATRDLVNVPVGHGIIAGRTPHARQQAARALRHPEHARAARTPDRDVSLTIAV